MDAGELRKRGEIGMPAGAVGEFREALALGHGEQRTRFDEMIFRGSETIAREFAQSREYVRGEVAAMRSLLDDDKGLQAVEPLPHFRELPREQPPEEWTDAHVRKEVARAPDRSAPGRVVAVLGMVERELHEVA